MINKINYSNLRKKIGKYHIFMLIYILSGIASSYLSYNYKLNREHIGIIFIIGSILSIYVSRNFPPTSENYQNIKGWSVYFFKISLIVWISLAILSIIIFSNSRKEYYLPLIYFLTISLMATIISMQILIPKNLSKFVVIIIFIEIIILSTILNASFIYLFSSPYGNDSLIHIGYISSISNTGNIDSYGYAGQYHEYPLYHILFAETMMLSNIDNDMALLVFGLIQVIILLFVLIMSSRLFNIKAGLLSVLVISLATYLLIPKYTHFTGSFAIIFFMIFLYFLLFRSDPIFSISVSNLIIFIGLNFIHPLIPIIIIFTIFIVIFGEKILKLTDVKMKNSFIFLNIILMLYQWTRSTKGGILVTISESIKSIFEGRSVTQATLSQFYSRVDIILYELGYIILVLFGIVGALAYLKPSTAKQKTVRIQEKGILLSIITLVFVPIPYFLALIFPNSLPARWFPYIEVLVGIFAGGILTAYYKDLSKYKFMIFIIMFILIFFLITSPIANPNSQLYSKELATRSGLTMSEEEGITFAKINYGNDSVRGNSKYAYFFYGFYPNDTQRIIDPRDNNTFSDGLLMIRDYDMDKGFTIPLWGKKGLLLDIVYPTPQFLSDLDAKKKIYDSQSVNMYLNADRFDK